jgi:uncharacterized protein YjiS (DUF1127 family)
MKTHAQAHTAAHVTLLSHVQEIVKKFSAAAAKRRARRQEMATLEELRQLDARLLDDIGMALPKRTARLEGLAQMNPAFLAASAFSLPRKDRR